MTRPGAASFASFAKDAVLIFPSTRFANTSSSMISKRVYRFIVCNRPWILLVNLSIFACRPDHDFRLCLTKRFSEKWVPVLSFDMKMVDCGQGSEQVSAPVGPKV